MKKIMKSVALVESIERRVLLSKSVDFTSGDFQQAPTVQLNAETTGGINGNTFVDANANGVLDSGADHYLGMGQVYLDLNMNGHADTGEPSTALSLASGYRFDGLTPGNYRIVYTPPTDYHLSSANNYRDVTVTGGLISINNDFAIYANCAISGGVYNDANDNGQVDGGETSLVGWQVFLDANRNGIYDYEAGDISAVTVAGGAYSFTNLKPGSYRIIEVIASGWRRTAPASGYVDVTLTSGLGTFATNFLNTQKGRITGNAFEDQNVNGTRDGTEVALAGRSVFIDSNLNGSADAGEPFAVTDASGFYQFTNLVFGHYSVRQVLPVGWLASTSASTSVDVFSSTIKTWDLGSIQAANITGAISNDANDNGSVDAGDTALVGWQVFLDSDKDGVWDTGEPLATTDSSGAYSFTVVPGTYRIAELLTSGWRRTSPGGSYIETTVLAGQSIAIASFSNTQKVRVGGSIYIDANSNGGKDDGEAGVNDWTVFLDTNANGILDGNEASVKTAGGGAYLFTNLAAGSYRVAAICPAGWYFRSPGAGYQALTLPTAANRTGIDFGVVQGMSVSGTSWNDSNNNGRLDSGELPVPSRQLFIDKNKNGMLDSGEPTTTTDATGKYKFSTLPEGPCRVVEVLATDWRPTAPASGYVDLTLLPAQDEAGVNFFSVQNASVSGVVFADANNNKVHDSTEIAAGGWTVFFDANKNGIFDSGEAKTTTDSNGKYQFSGLAPSTYRVTVVPGDGYVITTPASGYLDALLMGGQALTGKDFGALIPGRIHGVVANDSNNNGRRDEGESTLGGWTVFLDANNNSKLDNGELSAVTDVYGAYTIGQILPGTYRIVELVKSQWQVTSPVASFHNVTIVSNDVFGPADFLNIESPPAPGSISGEVFKDMNGNGLRDANDLPLSNWTVFIDTNKDGALDISESSLTTDASGGYRFTSEPAGNYRIGQVLPKDWKCTTPTSESFDVALSAGGTVTSLVFGNAAIVVAPGQPSPISISGAMYNDLNDNGRRDSREPALEGWKLFIDANRNGKLDAGEKSTTTDSSGNYTFTGLALGLNRVVPETVARWRQTGLAQGFREFYLRNGQDLTQTNFFETQKSVLGGILWNDLNGDGKRAKNEPVLSGRQVFIDSNRNGTLDAGELSIKTKSDGTYMFRGLAPAKHRVTQVLPPTWRRTTGVFCDVRTAAAGVSTFANFASTQKALICGNIFNDANANGKKDSGEGMMSAWRVYIDSNHDGIWQRSERSVLSDAAGNWSFLDLNPGKYDIHVVLRSRWSNTAPVTGAYKVTVAKGSICTKRLFGAAR